MEDKKMDDRAVIDAVIAECLNEDSIEPFPTELELGADREEEFIGFEDYE